MAKRPDPFAGAKLSEEVGLDQRLFRHTSTPQSSVLSEERTAERPDVPTKEGTAVSPKGQSAEQLAVSPKDRPKGRPEGPPVEGPARGPNQGSSNRPGIRADVWPGQKQRLVDHRSYDFFQDQVRWLNRRKVEFEETYGRRVAATDMVQLAVDLLIADFELNGEDSQVVRVLIRDERPSVRPAEGPNGRKATDDGDEEGSDG